MNVKFNCNNYVRVKLTDFGYRILKERHDSLNMKIIQRGGKGLGDFYLKKDAQGYYRTQFWSLMGELGQYLGMGRELPFSLNLIIEEAEEVEVPE